MTDTPMTQQDADRIEELIRYIAAHDGRLPTDEMPLAWWLVDMLDHPKDHPVRQVLAGIPITKPGAKIFPGKAHAWSDWLTKFDRIVWAGQRGQTIDEAVEKDKQLRDWVNLQLSRHQIGDLRPVESFLLPRAPLWDFNREPDTNKSRKGVAFKVGLLAVHSFHQENGHTDIPPGMMVGDLDLRSWWQFQRAAYANRSMKEFERSQIAKLGKSGIDLRPDKVRTAEDIVFRYRDRLKELADYIGKRGMSALPERGEKFMTTAQAWIAQYNKGTLEPELVTALEAIEGWSWQRDADLELVRLYAHTHGHVDIPADHVTADGEPLGAEMYRIQKARWISTHPTGAAKRRGKHVDELARKAWGRAIKELRNWFRGHDTLPARDVVVGDGFLLGGFVEHCLESAGSALLTWAQLKDLSDATGSRKWVDGDPEAYRKAFRSLSSFARGRNHCHPAWGGSPDAQHLARFILRVCADRDAGDMPPFDELKVEVLPGWAWSRRDRAIARQRAESRGGIPSKGPVRGVRTDLADPDTRLDRAGLKQFLPSD